MIDLIKEISPPGRFVAAQCDRGVRPTGKATGNSTKEESKAIEVFSTPGKMYDKSNTTGNLAQVSTRRLQLSQQSKCQPSGPCPSDLSGTGTGLPNTSTSTDTQVHVERETSPSSVFSDDLEGIFRKDTDTVMGVYGSDSIHSSVSEQPTDDDELWMGSPTKLIAAIEGIGSHFMNDHATRDNPEVQFNPMLAAQEKEASGVSRMVEGTYGESLDERNASIASSYQYSPDVLSRSH